MSLIHPHPGKLNPRVHYRSPFFDEGAARDGEAEAAQRAAAAARVARREAYRKVLHLSVRQAEIFETIVDAGAEGALRAAISSALAYGHAAGTSDFMKTLRGTLATRGLELVTYAGRGARRAWRYGLSEVSFARLERLLAGESLPLPRITVRRETAAERLARLYVLTPQQVVVMLALHEAGGRGLDVAGVRAATGIGQPHPNITRLELRLIKAGSGLERSETRLRYRLPEALRTEISTILAGVDPAD